MSSLSIDAKPIRLEELLDAVEGGSAGLPAFQRDFDWSTSDVISLLATLLSNWPAGSLLLMSGRPDFFEIRSFDDGPEVSGKVRYVVLDGQQRLTALFHALRGRGDFVYVLNAAKLLGSDGSAEAVEDAIFIVDHTKWRHDYSLERQAEEALVPLQELRTASDFFAWRDSVIDVAPSGRREELRKMFADVYREHLGRLNIYTFPAVLLDKSLPPAAVARIFERINRTGLRLNTFDLLVARVYAPDWNLRERWEEARRESEPIAHWLGEDGLPVVQAISLHLEGDIRQPKLLDLRDRDIRSNWDAALRAMEAAVQELRKIGIPASSWMPYKGLVFPIADRAMSLGSTSLDLPEIRTWLWSRSFGMDYGVGSSTRIAQDARLLSQQAPDWTSANLAVDRRVVRTATRKQQSALWSAFVSLLASGPARDLLSGEIVEDPAENAVVMSLFPRSTDESGHHLRVLGLVLLTRASAKVLRNDRTRFFREIKVDALESQLISRPGVGESLLDPEVFFDERLAMLEDRVNSFSSLSIRWFDGRESAS